MKRWHPLDLIALGLLIAVVIIVVGALAGWFGRAWWVGR